MKKLDGDASPWESASLEWIHDVRREERRTRRGQPPRPLPAGEAEKLARRYGLKLSRPAAGKPGR